MVVYTCEKCYKEFNRKCNYLMHVENKKKPCDSIIINCHQNPSNAPPKPSKIIEPIYKDQDVEDLNINNLNLIEMIKEYFCKFCDKKFTRKDSLTKHINERCKIKKKTDDFEVLKLMLTKILEEKGLLNKVLEENKVIMNKVLEENKEFKKEIERLKIGINGNEDIFDNANNTNTMNHSRSIIKTTNNNSNNTTNNTINNTINNTNNNLNNTNIIVQFGKEDLSKLDLNESMAIYLKSTGGNIIANMIKYINFNPKHPENFNIYMTDLAREIVKIHDGKKFISKRFKSVKGQIINNVSSHINDICDKYVNDKKTKKSNDIIKKININNISLNLINGDEIDELIRDKDNFENKKLIEDNVNDSEDDELTPYQQQQITYFEQKRQGLQDITGEKLRDELYNNRNLIE